MQTLLFPSQSDRDPRARAVNTSWRPPEPPSLDGINELDLDTETNGLHWWNGHRPIGMSLALPKGTVYLPWGHRGGNLDEDVVKRWARQELRGKRLRGFNLKFDVHMLREWGVDLEAQGCTLNDLSLSAALLDDHRMKFKLEDIAQEFLGIGKLKDVDVEHLAELHASEVAPYAERDVELTARLSTKMRPLLEQQELTRVQALEDATIFAVCEMERNAAPIDVSLLNRWIRESAADVLRIVQEIDKTTGIRVDPQKTASFEEVFLERGLELSARTEGGAWSFDDEVMSGYDDPIIKKLQYARRLSSLRAKYLTAYHRALHNGRLRYNLHQLRGDFEESAGTITGRFSASDKNIQQVMAVEKQIERFGGAYIIRELFLPDGGLFLSADAAQIEYRLFADKAASPKLLAAYKQDPRTSFHKVVWEMVKPFKADIRYKAVKNLNFACVAVDTPVLTADLRWVRAADLNVEDELFAFDEHKLDGPASYMGGRCTARRWRSARVVANSVESRECVEILLDNGDTLVSTVDHPWLVDYHDRHTRSVWVLAGELTTKHRLMKLMSCFERDLSWESGWLAGFLDGEGCASGGVSVGQNEGPTLDMAERLLREKYGHVTRYAERFDPRGNAFAVGLNLRGPISDKLEFLGRIRPERLIHNLVNHLMNRHVMMQVRERPRVVSVRSVGLRDVAVLGTSTATFIADGYAAHNSLYGAGIRKIAHMLHVPEDEAKTFVQAYDSAFPEVKRLLTLAARRAEERGWVKTLSGRRIRFVRSCECRACARMGPRFHKALNGVIQGSAADVMKTKLVELHAERKYTGLKMRFTVHDEVCGDVPDHAAAGRVHEVLNRQSYELKVPILWETAVGPNWGKVTALKDNQFTGTVEDDTRDGRSRNKEPHP